MAVTFLTPGREEDYIEFLRVRQTPISPLTKPETTITSADADAVAKKIREVVKADRAVFEKAQRGFVSWVRAYSKHTASSIFRVLDLQWEEQGHAWGLLRLPSMPELKKFEGDRGLGLDFDINTLAYKDKVREKQRQDELKAKENGEGKAGKKQGKQDTVAWAQKKEQKATKEMRREKKMKKREHERVAKLTDEEKKKEDDLKKMIEQVREKALEEEEFGGFSD